MHIKIPDLVNLIVINLTIVIWLPFRNATGETPQKISPRVVSSEVASKPSPRSVSSDVPLKLSPRVVRQLKTASLDSDSATSSCRASRTPKDRSCKVAERKSPRSPVPEKKHPSRVAELEFQISQLQNDLKRVKDQLVSSEAWKKQAEQDAEESKKQLLEMSLKLEKSREQVLKKSGSEEALLIQPQKITEDQDSLLQSQLEAIKKQHSLDSAALASAVNEIKELKIQLESVAESEAARTKHAELSQIELNSLKQNLTETLAVMEDMKNELKDCKESEAQARVLVGETLMQLETAKRTVECLRSDGVKAVEAFDSIASELEQSRARINLLEGIVSELKADTKIVDGYGSQTAGDQEITFGTEEKANLGNSNEGELNSLKSEVEQLKSALEASEIRYSEEQSRNAAEIKSAYKLVEQIKSSSIDKEAELEAELQKTIAEVEELKADLMDKETELQGICQENEDLNLRLENFLSSRTSYELEKEIQKAMESIEHLKANLMDKETELQNIVEENEMLKTEIKKKEINKGKVNDEIVDELESARAAEREALMKLGYMTEEVDKSNRKVARVSEQLEAAQTANSEMEAELRRFKVQSDQWRKAAEAAAAMLSSGNNGKFMDRTGSMDSKYSPRSGRISSPYSDDGDDDLLKRKSPNMLKKIGVLWRKPQK
nr:interactor of constitutive active ROPs 3-like isoform X2 [Coffea arabica]